MPTVVSPPVAPRVESPIAAFDMSLVQRGARLRRTPFFAATQRYGAQAYTVYNHMLFPVRYAPFEEEYRHLIEHVTLWDVSVERQVEITGPDAFLLADRLTPRDLGRCAVGQGKYVAITAHDGGVINDPVLLRLGENHFWLALADSDVLLWARAIAQADGLRVEVREPDVSPLQVQGPRAKEVVRALFGDQVAGLRYYWFVETALDGIPVVVTRTGWTGEVGFEIYLRDGSRGEELWERIMEAGRPYRIRPTGPSDIRRIEAGILNWGADITLEDTPYHVGLERLVDESKAAEYVGREALARVRREGVTRRLVGLEIGGEPLDLNPEKWPVRSGGDVVGRVTSAVWSPRLEKNIGYAMVPTAHAAFGSALDVEVAAGERRPATVVRMPFMDPGKEIPKH